MELLSNTAKGEIFEAEVFSFIKDYVNSGESFLNPNKCQFFTQKGYSSKIRKRSIKVDISIESHIVSIDSISLLVVIECKNYKKNVPVDDVEEFVYKLEQIAGKNIKGIMFSRNGYSSGALEVAAGTGIALARLLPNDQVDWILERTPKHVSKTNTKKDREREIIKALTMEGYRGQSEALFSFYNNHFSTSFSNIFNKLISVNYNKDKEQGDNKTVRTLVPYLGQEDIEKRIEKILDYFKDFNIKNCYEVDINIICNYFSEKHNISFIYDKNLGVNSNGKEILGKLEVENRKIFITNTLDKNTSRWRFTLAHEIGHLLLHQNLNIPTLIKEHMDTTEILNWDGFSNKDNNLMRLEWQANSFASSLLLPREKVFKIIQIKLKELDIKNISSGVIYLDEQKCNIENYQNILFDMKRKFNVSYQAINYRLAQLRILNNQTKNKAVRELVAGLSIFDTAKP